MRLMPVVYRDGFRRVVRTPAHTQEHIIPGETKVITSRWELKPWRFRIYHRTSDVSHTFDSYEKLTAFVESLKPL